MATKLKKAPRWKVAVEVTSGDIKLGLKKNAEKCPIARALKYLKYLKFKVDEVSYDGIYFTYKGVGYVAGLPKAAQKFIECFDAGKTVKPFTFSLYPEKYEA